jgi:hypothetical protein
MPDTDEQIAAKIEALKPYGGSPQVCEFARVGWPAPDGAIWYGTKSVTPYLKNADLLAQIDGPIDIRLDQGFFLELTRESAVVDDKVDLDFTDLDGEITRLQQTHGEGARVEVFYYFPQVDLMWPEWWGHLRPPTEADGVRFKASAEFGFLSNQLPLPRRGQYASCSAMYGGLLQTLEEVAENDCPYNVHLGGATGNPGFPTCPQNRAACIARLGDDKSFLGSDTVIQSYTVGQHGGTNVTVTTRGNENNLKRPLRVVFGERDVQDCDLQAFTIEPDTKHPEGGAVTAIFKICEGPIQGQNQQKINNQLVGYQHLNVRNGELRQSRTGFSVNVSNYSGTALFFGRVQGDFTKITADQLRGSVHVFGLRDVRVYTDANTYTKQYSQDRAWALFRILTDKRWGRGWDIARLRIEDFIYLSAWFAEIVTVHDKDGNVVTGPRSSFNAELIDRTAQEQVTDICRTGRCSLPYPDRGKIRIKPLKKATEDELANAPVFSDRGTQRNILAGTDGNSLLSWSEQSDRDLANQWIVTYDDATHANAETPLIFESAEQQLAAGREFGDFTRHTVSQTIPAFGSTGPGEAARFGNFQLNLGEFDEGGLKNNLRWTLTTWFAYAIELTKYDFIKLDSAKLDRVNAVREAKGLERFDYFRVRSFRRMPDLKVEINVQAYPVAYYEQMESEEAPAIPPVGYSPNPGGGGGLLPFESGFGDLSHTNDRISFRLEMLP